jgi:hypothetical protein
LMNRIAVLCSAAALLGILSMIVGCSEPNSNAVKKLRLAVEFPDGPNQVPLVIKTDLPADLEPDERGWEAVPVNGEKGDAVPVQFGEEGKLVFLWRQTKACGKREFEIRPSGNTSAEFKIEQASEKQLLISRGGIPAIGYVHGMQLAEGVPEDRRRSCYFHPLWSADGSTVLSDDFPEDHYHHRGVFWTWPQVFVHDDTLSLWDIRGIKQKFESWLVRESGPVFAQLGVRNGWYTDDGQKVVDERVLATVYNASGLGRMIDFEFRWEATESRVGIQGSADIKGYGGFSLRFAPFKEPKITTIEGVQSEDSNRIPVAWADLSARFGDSDSIDGVSIFDHSGNIKYPNGWCLRHYGFTGLAWPGIEPYWLEPGKPLIARYRMWIHAGGAIAGETAEAYNGWANPPVAVVIE